MKKYILSALALFLLLLLPSCYKQEDHLDASKKQTLYSISYGPHQRNQLDIMLPANRTQQTPVVIFIHGGAWIGGDKSVFSGEFNQYADAGFACATMNYRFASDLEQVYHPALPEDVKKAVDFIASKSQTWQVAPDRFGLVGHSAGGHLALITSYAFNSDNRIKACASWAGPVDFTDSDQLAIAAAPALFQTYMGRSLQSAADTAAYRSASPYWNVQAQSVPSMLIYATNDELVPFSNGIKMQAMLDSAGVNNNFKALQGASHTWGGNYLTESRNLTLQWFQQHL